MEHLELAFNFWILLVVDQNFRDKTLLTLNFLILTPNIDSNLLQTATLLSLQLSIDITGTIGFCSPG